jgi:hypothetical protein
MRGREMKRRLGRWGDWYSAICRRRYLKWRRIACHAPFPVHIYQGLLLQALSNPRIRVLPFTDTGSPSANQTNLYVRHDIDTRECVQNMALLLDIDQEVGVRAGVYFRADDGEYALEDYRKEIQAYRATGFEIGLHTVCYLKDDYLDALRKETELFTRSLGFSPTSFTVHGMGPCRMDVRMRFCEEICGRLAEFGFTFSDCCPHLRSYDHTIHDSHWNTKERVRFLYSDFIRLPLFSRGSSTYVLLTHPGYWFRPDERASKLS